MNGEINKVFIEGDFIGVKEEVNTFSLYKNFKIKNFTKATLKATALGMYVVKINGKRVSDNYFMPGFTTYQKILQVQVYDVTNLLKIGDNNIEIMVNEGWYAGRFGLDDQRKNFGDKPYALASLKVENNEDVFYVNTDSSFLAKENYIVSSGIYDGEIQDFTRALKPLTTCVFNGNKELLIEQICQPVKNQERFDVKEVIRTPKGELVYDFGQNIAGVVEITCREKKEILLQFAEILDKDGNFYKENLRSAKGECHVKTDGPQIIDFQFTYYGFRYVKVVSENVDPKDIVAVARYTDLERRGELKVSHKKLQRFIENTLWSQRDNFVDIPTDCPQRDERLGWTGDINAFCITASYTYDIRLFMKKWLACLRCDQKENGDLPVVTPDVVKWFYACSMWCDSAIMIPYKLYNHYGDISFLEDNYNMMKKYIHAKEIKCKNGMITEGFEYGDWLALDSEECSLNKVFGGTDIRYISNLFFYECLKTIAKVAKILNKETDEEKYLSRAEKLLKDIRKEYITPNGRLAVSTVTAQVLALSFNILEEKDIKRVASDLNQNVLNHKCHVTTGFIGTAYLLFALADNGYWDTATKVLLNEEYPGWLHEVDMGATTVWERWDSLLPDGTPNPDGMTSFNHYAYGSVVEFIWRRIAGIENTSTAFKTIKIAPHPVDGVDNLSASFKCHNGIIRSCYKRENGKTTYNISVPKGIDATIIIDGKVYMEKAEGDLSFTV